MQENSTSVSVYFPAAKWYSLYNYAVVDASGGSNTQSFEVHLPLEALSAM